MQFEQIEVQLVELAPACSFYFSVDIDVLMYELNYFHVCMIIPEIHITPESTYQ